MLLRLEEDALYYCSHTTYFKLGTKNTLHYILEKSIFVKDKLVVKIESYRNKVIRI